MFSYIASQSRVCAFPTLLNGKDRRCTNNTLKRAHLTPCLSCICGCRSIRALAARRHIHWFCVSLHEPSPGFLGCLHQVQARSLSLLDSIVSFLASHLAAALLSGPIVRWARSLERFPCSVRINRLKEIVRCLLRCLQSSWNACFDPEEVTPRKELWTASHT